MEQAESESIDRCPAIKVSAAALYAENRRPKKYVIK